MRRIRQVGALVGASVVFGLGCDPVNVYDIEDTITGTWVNEAGGLHTVISIGRDRLVVTSGNTTFEALKSKNGFDVTYRQSTHTPSEFRADQDYNDLDLGAMPLPLGGTTTVRGVDGATTYCTGALDAAEASAQCSQMSGLPSWLPNLNGTALATKTSAVGTIFAELGGSWAVTPSGGGSCHMNISPAKSGGDFVTKVDFNCTASGSKTNGWIHLTFNGDYVSGLSSSGVDLAAVRQ